MGSADNDVSVDGGLYTVMFGGDLFAALEEDALYMYYVLENVVPYAVLVDGDPIAILVEVDFHTLVVTLVGRKFNNVPPVFSSNLS